MSGSLGPDGVPDHLGALQMGVDVEMLQTFGLPQPKLNARKASEVDLDDTHSAKRYKPDDMSGLGLPLDSNDPHQVYHRGNPPAMSFMTNLPVQMQLHGGEPVGVHHDTNDFVDMTQTLGVPTQHRPLVHHTPVVQSPTLTPTLTVGTPLNLVSHGTPGSPSDSGLPEPMKKKKRSNLPKAAVEVLKQWLFANMQHPYPSEEQKVILTQQTGLAVVQVNNWFINARRRILPPVLKGGTSSPAKQQQQYTPQLMGASAGSPGGDTRSPQHMINQVPMPVSTVGAVGLGMGGGMGGVGVTLAGSHIQMGSESNDVTADALRLCQLFGQPGSQGPQ